MLWIRHIMIGHLFDGTSCLNWDKTVNLRAKATWRRSRLPSCFFDMVQQKVPCSGRLPCSKFWVYWKKLSHRQIKWLKSRFVLRQVKIGKSPQPRSVHLSHFSLAYHEKKKFQPNTWPIKQGLMTITSALIGERHSEGILLLIGHDYRKRSYWEQ